jgi:hypothetical protein
MASRMHRPHKRKNPHLMLALLLLPLLSCGESPSQSSDTGTNTPGASLELRSPPSVESRVVAGKDCRIVTVERSEAGPLICASREKLDFLARAVTKLPMSGRDGLTEVRVEFLEWPGDLQFDGLSGAADQAGWAIADSLLLVFYMPGFDIGSARLNVSASGVRASCEIRVVSVDCISA